MWREGKINKHEFADAIVSISGGRGWEAVDHRNDHSIKRPLPTMEANKYVKMQIGLLDFHFYSKNTQTS